jgi:hypothetical protein
VPHSALQHSVEDPVAIIPRGLLLVLVSVRTSVLRGSTESGYKIPRREEDAGGVAVFADEAEIDEMKTFGGGCHKRE